MTITRPCRRMTLQLSQIFLTLGLTFMAFLRRRSTRTARRRSCGWLLVAVDDTTAGEVVRAQLDDDPVLGEDPDVVLTHLARDVREHLVAVAQLHPEHRVGQCLDNTALEDRKSVGQG